LFQSAIVASFVKDNYESFTRSHTGFRHIMLSFCNDLFRNDKVQK